MRNATSVASKMTSTGLNTNVADEAVRVMSVEPRTEAIHAAPEETLTSLRFKKMIKNTQVEVGSPTAMIDFAVDDIGRFLLRV